MGDVAMGDNDGNNDSNDAEATTDERAHATVERNIYDGRILVVVVVGGGGTSHKVLLGVTSILDTICARHQEERLRHEAQCGLSTGKR